MVGVGSVLAIVVIFCFVLLNLLFVKTIFIVVYGGVGVGATTVTTIVTFNVIARNILLGFFNLSFFLKDVNGVVDVTSVTL